MSYKHTPEYILWELMEMEAKERYFLDRKGFKAERAGIIISMGVFTAPDAKPNEFYTVWFGTIAHWNFKSLKKAREKVQEILSKAVVPITPRVETR